MMYPSIPPFVKYSEHMNVVVLLRTPRKIIMIKISPFHLGVLVLVWSSSNNSQSYIILEQK